MARALRPPRGVAPCPFIPAGRLGLGPDNRKRSQMKSPHIASVVGRRKPVDRAGDVGRNRGSSSTVRTGEIGADRRETHQCSPTQAQDAAAHFDGLGLLPIPDRSLPVVSTASAAPTTCFLITCLITCITPPFQRRLQKRNTPFSAWPPPPPRNHTYLWMSARPNRL